MKMKTLLKRHRTPCRVAGCTAGPFKNAVAERTHFHRTHSGRIRTRFQKPGPVTLAETNGSHPVDLGSDRRLSPDGRTKKKHIRRGPYKKQAKAVQVEVLFCPSCGTDLKAVAIGMLLKGAKVNVSFCPGCGLDLHNVAIGMAMKPMGK